MKSINPEDEEVINPSNNQIANAPINEIEQYYLNLISDARGRKEKEPPMQALPSNNPSILSAQQNEKTIYDKLEEEQNVKNEQSIKPIQPTQQPTKSHVKPPVVTIGANDELVPVQPPSQSVQPSMPQETTTENKWEQLIKNARENKERAFSDQTKWLIDREKYAQSNARMQKRGDAFKSLVDLIGGISGGYVKERQENPYLIQAFKEMETLPRERFALQNQENDYLLNYWMGREAKDDAEQRWRTEFDQRAAQHAENIDFKKEEAEKGRIFTAGENEKKNAARIAAAKAGKTVNSKQENPVKTTRTYVSYGDKPPLYFDIPDDLMNNIISIGLANNKLDDMFYSQKPIDKGKYEKKEVILQYLNDKPGERQRAVNSILSNYAKEMSRGDMENWINNFYNTPIPKQKTKSTSTPYAETDKLSTFIKKNENYKYSDLSKEYKPLFDWAIKKKVSEYGIDISGEDLSSFIKQQKDSGKTLKEIDIILQSYAEKYGTK